jgi:hypothetical protein
MRTLLATLIAVSGFLAASAVTSTADAARKHRRDPGPSHYYAPPNPYYARPPPAVSERLACEERAQAADPAGLYAGYPCWAREAFGRGSSGGRGR